MRPSSSPTLSFALATVLITLSTAQAAAVPDEGKRVARVAKLEASAVPSVVLNAVTASPISTVTYSSLVAFGASYTDNAHPRNAEYASSLRNYWPYSKYGGRYQNGPVAVEQMVSSNISPKLKQSTQGIKLFDQAYGGSVIQNGLAGTWSSSPAAQDRKSYGGVRPSKNVRLTRLELGRNRRILLQQRGSRLGSRLVLFQQRYQSRDSNLA